MLDGGQDAHADESAAEPSRVGGVREL